MTWADASGSIWVFGGLGYDESNPINGELNDLWKYSAGEWTWMGGPKVKQQPGVYGTKGVAAASNLPGARLGAFGWIDASGDSWVFGGYGYDSNRHLSGLNDQWKYSSGEWTWVSGSNVVNQIGICGTKESPRRTTFPEPDSMALRGPIRPGTRGSGVALVMIRLEAFLGSTICGSLAAGNGPGCLALMWRTRTPFMACRECPAWETRPAAVFS